MKLRLWHILVLTIILVPASAYIDTIRNAVFPFREYLSICLWEAGLVWIGVFIGLFAKTKRCEE